MTQLSSFSQINYLTCESSQNFKRFAALSFSMKRSPRNLIRVISYSCKRTLTIQHRRVKYLQHRAFLNQSKSPVFSFLHPSHRWRVDFSARQSYFLLIGIPRSYRRISPQWNFQAPDQQTLLDSYRSTLSRYSRLPLISRPETLLNLKLSLFRSFRDSLRIKSFSPIKLKIRSNGFFRQFSEWQNPLSFLNCTQFKPICQPPISLLVSMFIDKYNHPKYFNTMTILPFSSSQKYSRNNFFHLNTLLRRCWVQWLQVNSDDPLIIWTQRTKHISQSLRLRSSSGVIRHRYNSLNTFAKFFSLENRFDSSNQRYNRSNYFFKRIEQGWRVKRRLFFRSRKWRRSMWLRGRRFSNRLLRFHDIRIFSVDTPSHNLRRIKLRKIMKIDNSIRNPFRNRLSVLLLCRIWGNLPIQNVRHIFLRNRRLQLKLFWSHRRILKQNRTSPNPLRKSKRRQSFFKKPKRRTNRHNQFASSTTSKRAIKKHIILSSYRKNTTTSRTPLNRLPNSNYASNILMQDSLACSLCKNLHSVFLNFSPFNNSKSSRSRSQLAKVFLRPFIISPQRGYSSFRAAIPVTFKIRPRYSFSFTSSPFSFAHYVFSPLNHLTELMKSVQPTQAYFKSLVFPDSDSVKASVFRRLSKQRSLWQSRAQVTSNFFSNFNRARTKGIATQAKANSVPSGPSLIPSSLQTKFPLVGRDNDFYNYTAINHLMPRKFRSPITPRIRRIRFKPGYGRMWRTARISVKDILGIHVRYQYRLTPKLQKLYFKLRSRRSEFLSLTLGYALMLGRFAFDRHTLNELLLSYNVFLNGSSCSNSRTHLFVNDFIQLVVNIRFYLILRVIKASSLARKFKFTRIFYRKTRSIDYKKYYKTPKTSRNLPNYFFDLEYTQGDIPKYFEIDYFSLSLFVVHDQLMFEKWLPTRSFKYNPLTLNMYNWKYIT